MAIKLQPEERFQVFLVRRLRDVLPPEVEFWANEPNSNINTSTAAMKQASINRWQRLKNKGVISDVADLTFSWPGGGIGWLELKWGKNTPSDGQNKWLNRRHDHGHKVGIAWTAAQVETILTGWGFPLRGRLSDLDARLAIEAEVRRPAKRARKPREPKPSGKAKRFAAFAQMR